MAHHPSSSCCTPPPPPPPLTHSLHPFPTYIPPVSLISCVKLYPGGQYLCTRAGTNGSCNSLLLICVSVFLLSLGGPVVVEKRFYEYNKHMARLNGPRGNSCKVFHSFLVFGSVWHTLYLLQNVIYKLENTRFQISMRREQCELGRYYFLKNQNILFWH